MTHEYARDSKQSCGSPASRGSSSRDGSLARGGLPGSAAAAAATAARNELKNQKTVRVQLSRPTEDMVPEPGEAKIRRGNQHQRAETNGASWHPASSMSNALSRDSSASVGGIGGDGSARASEWASDILKEHKKRRSFIHIPSRSVDLGGGGSGGTSMADIFGDSSERSSRASTSVALTTSGSGSGLVNGFGGREGGGGGAKGKKHRRNASGSSLSSLALNYGGGGGSAAPPGDAGGRGSEEAEELVGADSAGNGGVVVKKVDVEKLLERLRDGEDEPHKVPANRRAREETDRSKKEEDRKEQDRREARGGGGVAAAASSLPNVGASPPDGVHSVSVELGERDAGESSSSSGGEGEGEQEGERKDAGEGEEDSESEPAWDAQLQLTPKASRKKAPPAAMSTPGSKRRLVTEVIGDGDDVDVSRPQDMDEGEVCAVGCFCSILFYLLIYFLIYLFCCTCLFPLFVSCVLHLGGRVGGRGSLQRLSS